MYYFDWAHTSFIKLNYVFVFDSTDLTIYFSPRVYHNVFTFDDISKTSNYLLKNSAAVGFLTAVDSDEIVFNK